MVYTTDLSPMMRCRKDGLPIAYEHGKAKKVQLTEDVIAQADLDGMSSKIGFITNVSSSYHAMMYNYPEGSAERDEIERRLIWFRFFQGEEIDGAKNGGVKKKVPEHWTKWDSELSKLEKEIVSDRRPEFTKYLYDGYMRKYKDEIDRYDKYSWSHFGKSFEDVLAQETRTPEENKMVNNYYKYSFFIFSDSPMNRISRRVDEKLLDISYKISNKGKDFDYSDLFSTISYNPDPKKIKQLKSLFRKYNSSKKAWRASKDEFFKKDLYSILDGVGKEALEEITSNAEELGNLAVQLMIEDKRTRTFGWTVFGDFIIDNILNRHGHQIDILVKDEYGDYEFMYEKYSSKKVFV